MSDSIDAEVARSTPLPPALDSEANRMAFDQREPESQREITRECNAIRDMLLAKNAAYGDSALSPVRVFSRAGAEEQIRVRIDDKLSRLARGSDAGEDVVLDLIGYLVLLRVARARAKGNE